MIEDSFTIGVLAQKSRTPIQTIRYYEKEGLIEPDSRLGSGYRQYSSHSINRLIFIHHAKELGFTLREIKELLMLGTDPDKQCKDIRQEAEHKLLEVRHKITRLKEIEKSLSRLVSACHEDLELSRCPILQYLELE